MFSQIKISASDRKFRATGHSYELGVSACVMPATPLSDVINGNTLFSEIYLSERNGGAWIRSGWKK